MLVLEPQRIVSPIDDAPDGALEIEPRVVPVAHVFGAEDDAIARNANFGIAAPNRKGRWRRLPRT
jgi:hypothetical protein